MLRFNLTRVFKARGIDRPAAYLKSKGYSISAATRMVSNETRGFSLSNIEKICITLNCTPNDLIEWVPPTSLPVESNHALCVLKRNDILESVSQLVNGASIEQLEKMNEMLRKEMGML